MTSLLARLDAVQQRRRGVAVAWAVLKKFSDDRSSNLATLIAYYTFFSVFPLLLALAEALGLVLHGHPGLQATITGYAAKNLPKAIQPPKASSGSVLVVVIGGVLALYSGLSVAKTAQSAWNTVYLVPRGDQPGFLPATLRAARLVLVGGLGLIVSTALAGAASGGDSIGLHIGAAGAALGFVITAVLNTGLFVVVFRLLTVRAGTVRQVLPGAALSAVALLVLQSVATAFISHKLKSSESTYGSFATVIVLLSWFYLQAQVLLLSAQLNVVRADRLWPRAMPKGAPTDADERAHVLSNARDHLPVGDELTQR